MDAKVPPDIVFAGCAVLCWLLARYFPGFNFGMPLQGLVSGIIVLLGLIVVFWAKATLSKYRTTAQPNMQALSRTTVLVTTGPYKYSRNPIYLGMAMLLLGWWLIFANWIGTIGVVAFIVMITRFQIVPEERMLTCLFDGKYTDYKSGVRRWFGISTHQT